MLRRALIAALVLLVATAGCTNLSREGRRGTIAAGAIISASSIFVIRSGANDSDYDGVNENPLNDDWGAYMAGTGLLLAGLGMLVGGLASSEEQPDRTVTYMPPVAPPVPVAPAYQPMLAAPGATQTVEVERVSLVALPELPATADVLRLAKQVRSASIHGRCDAAWIMWTDLQKLDGTYATALRAGPVMARCAM